MCKQTAHAVLCGIHPDGEEEGFGGGIVCNNCAEKQPEGTVILK